MDPEPEVIRQEIEQTRESLTEKLETLEDQVKDTISNVTSTVEQTVDTVKSKVEGTVEAITTTVESTVQTVKRTFDLPYQIRRHPYGMTGGALATGAVLGWLLTGRGEHRGRSHLQRRPMRTTPPMPATTLTGNGTSPTQHHAEGPGLWSRILEPLAGEFDNIKATAIGAVMGMVRDFARRSVPPSLAPQVEEILDNITRRAGGEVIRGPILREPEPTTPAPGPSGFSG